MLIVGRFVALDDTKLEEAFVSVKLLPKLEGLKVVTTEGLGTMIPEDCVADTGCRTFEVLGDLDDVIVATWRVERAGNEMLSLDEMITGVLSSNVLTGDVLRLVVLSLDVSSITEEDPCTVVTALRRQSHAFCTSLTLLLGIGESFRSLSSPSQHGGRTTRKY